MNIPPLEPQLSTLNTSTTALNNGETFTGTGERNAFPDVGVSCKTDQDGTLYFDFSNDNTNWDTFPTSGFSITAGIHSFHTAVKLARYFRVRLTNDSGSNQTYLRLYTYFGSYRQGNLPLNQGVRLDQDALLVRSTVAQDEIRIGRRTGVTGWNKFGYRTGLTAAGGEETVWASSSNFTPLTSAETFTITYNNANDGSSSTGAKTLVFYYVDSSGLPAVSTHTLGSTGSDVTSFSGLGINRCAVVDSGTLLTNGNIITITSTTSATVQAYIPTGGSVTQQCIFFVGSNHIGILKYLRYRVIKPSGGGNPKVTIKGYVYNRNVGTRYEVYRDFIDTAGGVEPVEIVEPIGFNLSPADVLWFVADTDTNNADVYMRFSLNEYQTT